MKKILAILLVALLGIPAFAAVQYNYGMISAAVSDYNKPDGSFTAFVNRAGAKTIGLQNLMYFNQSAYIYASFSKNMPSSFGVYTLSGNQIKDSYNLVQTADGKYTAADADGNFIKFSAGDSVGFWVADSNGNKVYNTPGVEGGNSHTYNGTGIVNGNEYVIGFGEYGQYVGSQDFDKMIADSAFVMNVQVGSAAPSGQPLPGILASLMIGGIGVCAGCRKKKKKA